MIDHHPESNVPPIRGVLRRRKRRTVTSPRSPSRRRSVGRGVPRPNGCSPMPCPCASRFRCTRSFGLPAPASSEAAGVSLLLNDSKELLIRPSRPNVLADGPACSTNQIHRYPRRREIGFGLDAVFGIGSVLNPDIPASGGGGWGAAAIAWSLAWAATSLRERSRRRERRPDEPTFAETARG